MSFASGRLFAISAALLLAVMAATCLALEEEAVLGTTPMDRSIKLTAGFFHTWVEDGVRVFTASGDCGVQQGNISLAADDMVIWFNQAEARKTGLAVLRIYAERNVTLIRDSEVRKFEQFLATFETKKGLCFAGNILTHKEPQVTPVYLRGQKVLKSGEAEYVSRKPLPPEAALEEAKPSEAIEIRADNFESWVEDGKRVVLLTGNVHVRKGEYEVTADRAIVWFSEEETKEGGVERGIREVYAEGDVTLFRREDVVRAERIFHNVIENKGIMTDARVERWTPERNVPLIFGGKEIRQIDRNRYQAEKGYFTTDDFGKPHFRFQGEKVRLIETKRSRVVNATHNRFYIGNIPVFYWPFLSKDIRDDSYFLRDLRQGHSSKFGWYVLSSWDLYDFALYQNDWSDATLNLDYYGRRGPAIGLNLDYRRDTFLGLLETYYVHDTADYDRHDMRIPSADRGRILWRHRQFLPRGYRLDAEFSYLSDRNFLREYFEQEFQEGKEQETVLYLRKLHDNKAFTLTGKMRVNHFLTKLQQLPVARFDVIGEPLLGGLLEYTSDSTLGGYKIRYDNALATRDTPNTLRFDTYQEISAPFKFSIVKLKPYIGERLTAYSDRTQSRGSDWRTASLIGLQASTNLSRIYPVRSRFLNINRLRHIITPEIRYENIYYVSSPPSDYYQFDDADGVDESQHIVLGLRNRFQTKRGRFEKQRVVDWIDLDIEYHAFPGTDSVYHGLDGCMPLDDFIEVDFLWRLSDRITIESRGNEINLSTGDLDELNLGVIFEYSPRWRLYIGHRYHDSDRSRDIDGRSVTFFDISYVFNEKWSASFLQKYDFKDTENIATRLILTRQLPGWILEVALESDPGENDTIASFSLSPSGLREAASRF